MSTFIGVDLGWYGKPSGLASIGLEGSDLHLRSIARLEGVDQAGFSPRPEVVVRSRPLTLP